MVPMAKRRRTRLRALALIALCLASSAGIALEAVPRIPPLMQPAVQERHPGKIIWADLVTPDLARSEHFYGALFGWTFEMVAQSAHSRPYALALLDGVPVAGILQRRPGGAEHRQPGWMVFISTADLDAAARNVVADGGRILAPARNVPDRGRTAVFADPQGAVFAALQSSSGDPPDVLAQPGQWIWSSLLAADPDRDAAFYKAVFGYQVFDQIRDDGVEHVLLASNGYARASVNALPPGSSGLHPHWLNFVRVANMADSVARVKALGGQVLVPPHLDRHGGPIAVVADPSGAAFGLLEWADIDPKEVTR